MTSPPTNLVVLDTNIWSQLYSAGRQHVDAPLWRKAMVGLEVVIAQQTRAEVLYGLRFSTFSATKKAKVLAQLNATPTIPIDENVIQAWVDLRANCRLRRPTPHALQDAKIGALATHDQDILHTPVRQLGADPGPGPGRNRSASAVDPEQSTLNTRMVHQ